MRPFEHTKRRIVGRDTYHSWKVFIRPSITLQVNGEPLIWVVLGCHERDLMAFVRTKENGINVGVKCLDTGDICLKNELGHIVGNITAFREVQDLLLSNPPWEICMSSCVALQSPTAKHMHH